MTPKLWRSEKDCALLRAHFLKRFLKDLEEENSKFSEVQRHLCLFTILKMLFPYRWSISRSCLLPWASCNKNRTFVKVLDTPFIWWETFTSLKAKCILNSSVVPVKKHPVPYILPSSQLIIYTPCRGMWYSLTNTKAHCVSQRTCSKYRQDEKGQGKKYLGYSLWWTGLERLKMMEKEIWRD